MYERELAFAGELADRADSISTSFFRGSFRIDRKDDGTPVTEADLAVEEALREALAARFPDDAVLVAWGAAAAMLEEELRIWDWAAVQVVVEEAGGRVTQFDGSPLEDGRSVLSTNGALHDELVTRLAMA